MTLDLDILDKVNGHANKIVFYTEQEEIEELKKEIEKLKGGK